MHCTYSGLKCCHELEPAVRAETQADNVGRQSAVVFNRPSETTLSKVDARRSIINM